MIQQYLRLTVMQVIPLHATRVVQPYRTPLSLLLANTNSPASPTCRLRMLTPYSQAPVVPQTPVSSNLLQPLQILTELGIDTVGQHLLVLAINNVALTIEEPRRNLVLRRILNDRDDALEFFGSEIASAGRIGE